MDNFISFPFLYIFYSIKGDPYPESRAPLGVTVFLCTLQVATGGKAGVGFLVCISLGDQWP